MFFNGFTIATGSQTNLQVDRTFSTYLEKPYSSCKQTIDTTYPSQLVQALLKKGYSYTQKTCFLACYQQYTIDLCGCYNSYIQLITGIPDLVVDKNERFCRNLTEIYCYAEVWY